MRSTFPGLPSLPVTLTRSDGSAVTLTVCGLPPGYRSSVRVEFPAPRIFVNGAPGGNDETKMPLYWERVAMILLAKSLEPSGEMDARRDAFPAGPDGWQKFADALTDEFTRAGFTHAEIEELQTAMGEVGAATRGTEDLGKSVTPNGG